MLEQKQVVKRDFRELPILIGFFYWWLRDVPMQILFLGKKLIVYFYNYFSITLLLKTLFDYWKKDEIDMTNLALDDRIRVMMMNLVSRFVGATVRSITILVGLFTVTAAAILTGVSFIGLILLPFIVIFFIINGLTRL